MLRDLRVGINGREIERWPLRKSRELLAYLLARGGTPVARDAVAEALWPEEPLDRIDSLLSEAAYRLRRTLRDACPDDGERQFLVSEGQRYHQRSHLFRLDLDGFNARIRRARELEGTAALSEYEWALDVYSGDFLEQEMYEWAEPWRLEYRRRFVAACHEAGRLAVDGRDVEKAAAIYGRLLASDPIDEEVARELTARPGSG